MSTHSLQFFRPIPHINGEKHYVRIEGAVDNVIELSIQELRVDFEQHEVISSLQVSIIFTLVPLATLI